MAMTPEERNRMERLEKMVMSMMSVENVAFIEQLNRRLDFLSEFNLADAQDVSSTTPTTGQVLKYNGTEWAPGTDNTA